MPSGSRCKFKGGQFSRVWILFILVVLAFSLVVPFGEPPDENAHLAYVHYLLTYQELPVQSTDPTQNPVQEGHHPPLYYAAVALLTGWAPYESYQPVANPYLPMGRDDEKIVQQFLHPVEERFPWRGVFLAAHIARLVSIGMAAAGVWITWQIGREMFPHHRSIPLLAAATHAFVPQLVYMSAAVNNDNAAIFMGSVITWVILRLFHRDRMRPRTFVVLGLALGVGILCKASLLAFLLPILFVTVTVALKTRRGWAVLAGAVLNLVCVIVPASLISGWWIARNLRLYGDPIGWNIWMATYAQFARRLPITFGYWMTYLWEQFRSFWGRFGWGRVLLPAWLYLGLLGLTLVGVIGLVRHLLRSQHKDHKARMFALLFVFFGFLVSTWRLGLSQDTVAAQGRFLFPSISAIAILLVTGWLSWVPSAQQSRASKFLISGFLALSVGVLLFRLVPVYVRPLRDELAPAAQSVQSDFDGRWELAGWQADPPQVGRTWPVTFYWRALQEWVGDEMPLAPILFAHLVDHDGQVIAGWDGVPTGGRFPPPAWSPDVLAIDTVRLEIPEDTEPGLSTLLVGFYDPQNNLRVPVQSTTHPVQPGALQLGPAMLRLPTPPSFQPQETTEAQFASAIRLLGYDLEADWDNETLQLVLYWLCEQPLAQDYVVFVHLLGREDAVAQGDGPPCGGGCPTALWQPGDIWRDEHHISVADLPAGDTPFTLSVGLYDLDSGDRLPVLAQDGTEHTETSVTLCRFSSWPEGRCWRGE